MLRNIENEYKYLVSAEQFQELLSECNAKYPFLNRKLQANYYYDTKDNTLNKIRTTVRIRQHHSDMKLQIKKHKEFKDALSISDEYIGKIDTLPSVLKMPDISDSLYLKGVLVTERKTFLIASNSIICFDDNMYLGICDYEIEIEVDEGDKDLVLMKIEHLGLIQKPIVSKSERFFKRLEEMNYE